MTSLPLSHYFHHAYPLSSIPTCCTEPSFLWVTQPAPVSDYPHETPSHLPLLFSLTTIIILQDFIVSHRLTTIHQYDVVQWKVMKVNNDLEFWKFWTTYAKQQEKSLVLHHPVWQLEGLLDSRMPMLINSNLPKTPSHESVTSLSLSLYKVFSSESTCLLLIIFWSSQNL